MPKINVYLPDELAEAVKDAGVPVSAICQRALEQAVRRLTFIRQAVLSEVPDGDLSERLPHVTPRAQAALKLAIDQARAASAPTVGTGYLLAGILAEGTNLALHVLQAIEIDPRQIRRDLKRRGHDEAAVPAEEPALRFSAPAAAALELAVTEAIALGHNYVGCEHLLLGLVAETDGVGGEVLRSLGADLRQTRRAVTAALAGYVHLRAQTAAADPATALSRHLQPLIERIERLEQRLGPEEA